ncbi:MAG: hypothetical protein JWO83_1208 [Caulobacteraceae bacterium]|nr:hypothetical protein [Caulobacteraceae bacterium]
MPILENPRLEAFAQAGAKGALLDDAYEAAGYVLARGHSSRLAKRPEVADRLAELRAEFTAAEDISPRAFILALLRVAKAAEEAKTPTSVREARLALVDAAKLRNALDESHRADRRNLTIDL